MKAGSRANAGTKGRSCLMYSLGESWKRTFQAALSTNNPNFAKPDCRSFQNQRPKKKKISYLHVLVRNGNLVYKEWFSLDLVKKIKQNQHWNTEEICPSVLKSKQMWRAQSLSPKGDPGAWRGLWHLNPEPSSTQLNTVAPPLPPGNSFSHLSLWMTHQCESEQLLICTLKRWEYNCREQKENIQCIKEVTGSWCLLRMI